MNRASMLWLAVALTVFGAALAFKHLRPAPAQPLLAWQRPVSELDPAQQARWHRVREGIGAAEALRAETGAWPAMDLTGDARWSLRTGGLAVNYEAEAGGLRWLVLFLEPDPRVKEPAPPDDDEHHTLADGTALHVTVWTRSASEPPGEVVSAFPAADGWVERVARRAE